MAIQEQLYTPEAFDAYIALPENVGRSFELIAGKVVEKVVANPRSSKIGALVLTYLTVFVEEHDLGYTTGADGGYRIGREKYITDAAYMSKARQASEPSEA
jgi:hypothetical protein